eukprot:scaffold106644_cov20-Tisochrysis_lutea.AAC.1
MLYILWLALVASQRDFALCSPTLVASLGVSAPCPCACWMPGTRLTSGNIRGALVLNDMHSHSYLLAMRALWLQRSPEGGTDWCPIPLTASTFTYKTPCGMQDMHVEELFLGAPAASVTIDMHVEELLLGAPAASVTIVSGQIADPFVLLRLSNGQ